MIALITGASSGIGADMARILSEKGYDVILVARNKRKMESLSKELKTNVEIIPMDISSTYNCTELYNMVKKKDIDILINNAGFGLFGHFNTTKLDKELDMIELNIKTVHTLTKLFLKDFLKKNKGHILNVASSAAFMPGPLMATYYATKAYIVSISESIREELKKEKSKVQISILCPGPVNTNFNKVANVKFHMREANSQKVAEYAIKKLEKGAFYIIPGIDVKMAKIGAKFSPKSLTSKITYIIQKRKISTD